MFNAIMLQAAAGQGGGMSTIIFLVLFIGVFYFFMIRPQQQQQKKLREERNNLKKGDHVITSGGLFGKIEGVKMGATDKKGNAVPESFLISLKPEYTITVQVSKECVFKDVNDLAAAQPQK